MFRRILDRLFVIAFRRIGFYKYPLIRKIYWNFRAKDIDDQWGKSKGDYDILRAIISSLRANRILDIGCGSGRLFPLWESLGIKEVIAQDIAQSALDLAEGRRRYPNIKLIKLPVESLDFPKSYFDLVISNRVLEHIPPHSIKSIIETICRLGKFVYINELSNTDTMDPIPSPSPSLFKHDYVSLFGGFGFTAQSKGLVGKQTWFLFTKATMV